MPEGFEELERDGQLELAAYVEGRVEALLRVAFPDARSEVVAPGWEDSWKEFHRPVRLGELWIGPPWERPDEDALAVVIDPGRAFGTGAHPTTRLCLEHLVDLGRGALVDLGCGSGVIAIAAARLGFAPVVALDVDPAAVACAQRNVRANRVDVDVRRSDVLLEESPPADVAIANIARAEVERIAQRLRARTLVTSGYLASEGPRLPEWTRRSRRVKGGWAGDVFARVSRGP